MCLSVNKEKHDETVNEILEARPERKEENEKTVTPDLLAQSTQYMRRSFQLLQEVTRKIKKSVYYKILTRTTQPAHVASIFLVLIISCCVWPEFQNHTEDHRDKAKSPLATFMYIASFAAHFGAQIWMTFVSGLALYFSLPRHTFGMCQEILFPKYFLLNTILSSVTLITFAKINTNFHDLRWIVQLSVLSLCVVIEMTIYLYLTPTLVKLMRAKYQFEEKLGNGHEIGHQQKFAGFRCPRYQQIHKNFRKVHIMCAIGNVVTICCSFLHLVYLASRITIS